MGPPRGPRQIPPATPENTPIIYAEMMNLAQFRGYGILIAALIVTTTGAAQTRPAITGISHMCVYASDANASDRFYAHDLGGVKGADPQNPNGARYYFSPTQFVEVLPLPAGHGISRMACVAFSTADARTLREYLRAHDVPNVGELETANDASRWFTVKDPEGNAVQFIQQGRLITMPADAKPIGTRIIHVGYLVHSRAAEDRFYRELLGFRPYWFGARNPDHIDWVSQQVPDGHDWLEYMMVGDGSDVPLDKVDANQLGVLNHFSIGVRNMEDAVTTLIREDRMSPKHNGPQMGLDGKWQANLYDPDATRIELMEFQPVTKPCCSAFTAESPVR
jgi:catechol 2,3-dioxygenase-like lactoylglutathione lyase family enzyme